MYVIILFYLADILKKKNEDFLMMKIKIEKCRKVLPSLLVDNFFYEIGK